MENIPLRKMEISNDIVLLQTTVVVHYLEMMGKNRAANTLGQTVFSLLQYMYECPLTGILYKHRKIYICICMNCCMIHVPCMCMSVRTCILCVCACVCMCVCVCV